FKGAAMNHQHTMDCLDQLYQLLTSMQGQINLLVDVLHSCPRHELSISSDNLLNALVVLSQQLEAVQDIASGELPETLGLNPPPALR
ncbi:MAG: hypothetical protein M9960_09435, partial [Xanthomonadaceae bacterium]|nr:hypothetical protein [Xanthomonadaceae bacterium]